MKTKIFWGNQYVSKFNCDGSKKTKWQKFKSFIKRMIRMLFILGLLYLIFISGTYFKPVIKHVFVEREVIVETIPPVMERIAMCESGGTHYKDGQVIFNANKNGSVDIGKYQINSVWRKKATEMKLDLTKESDNEKFAMYLYHNFGTEHWYSSVKCWNK